MGLVFYQSRTGFYLEFFSTSSDPGGTQVKLASGWLERWGTTMEPEERAELDGQLEELKAEFARQVAGLQGAAEVGITDYESYLAWEEDPGDTEEASNLFRAIWYDTNINMIQSLIQFMEAYDALAADQASVQRSETVEEQGGYGFLPSIVTNNTDEFFRYFAIWCAFSGVLLLSPTLVRDRLCRTRAIQWTARRGRQVLNMQVGAALLSGLLLTLLNCVLYLGPFLSTGALIFRDCPLTSVWPGSYAWLDWTYGQYLLVLLGLTLLLTLAACGFAGVLSRFSRSYVAMLLKAIPLIFVLCWWLVPWVMTGVPGKLTGLRGMKFACGALAALLALALCGWICFRQRRQELTA